MSNSKKWSQIIYTNPQEHRDDHFIYLVHAILDDPIAIQMQRYSNSIEGIHNNNSCKKTSRGYNEIANKEIISCSLIGNGYIGGEPFKVTTTFSNIGYILKVPYQNILYSDVEDLGTDYLQPQKVIEKYSQMQDKGPIELLFNTKEGNWNEVIVQGSTEYGKVEVVGIFINCYNHEMNYQELLLAATLARKLNQPLIKIFEGYNYPKEKTK